MSKPPAGLARSLPARRKRSSRSAWPPWTWPATHTNAKTVFAEAHGLRRGVGMAKALGLAGLPLEGRHHRGDDDAWNIVVLILQLHGTGNWPGPRESQPTA